MLPKHQRGLFWTVPIGNVIRARGSSERLPPGFIFKAANSKYFEVLGRRQETREYLIREVVVTIPNSCCPEGFGDPA